jgi:hypothetical protein
LYIIIVEFLSVVNAFYPCNDGLVLVYVFTCPANFKRRL